MAWRLRDIPKTVLVNGNIWEIRYCRSIENEPDAVGLCDSHDKEILIVTSICQDEKARTLIHELIHAIEFEYDIQIPHNLVYKLEEPIYRLICDNWRYILK